MRRECGRTLDFPSGEGCDEVPSDAPASPFRHPVPTTHAFHPTRRRLAFGAMLSPLAGLWPGRAMAGAQIEEPLANAVRSALSAAIADAAPPRPSFDNFEARLAYLRWLGEMSGRLRKRESEALRRDEFLETAWYESTRAGLDPALLLGLIQVESGFRRWAVSSAGARGYTQVMPFWATQIGDGDPSRLFHMQTNLRFGCVILRHYLDMERGDLFMALGRYNGSRGRSEYPNAVLGSQRQWVYKPAIG